MVLGQPRFSAPPGYGGHLHDDYDFYYEFDLDDMEDETLRELARRARDAGREVTLALGGGPHPPRLVVGFSACGNSRNVTISSGNSSMFSDIDFAGYEFLSRYDAVWDKRSDTVEAKVRWTADGATKYVLSRSVDPAALVVTGPAGSAIRFGDSSEAAQGLLGCRAIRDATLTLTGTRIASCEDAVIRLDSIGAAFLFQLSLARGYLCSLAELPTVTDDPVPRLGEDVYQWDLEPAFPQRSIPPDPLKLYYYAGTLSNEYPSLRFLAYYQVIEYFFSRYSRRDTAPPARRRRSEREQLQDTITSCVHPGLLRSLLTSYEHDGVPLGRHLADRRRLTGVAPVDTDRTTDDGDLLTALARRIYGIRNRIVHAKQGWSEDDSGPIFPFSPESAALRADVETLRYVAASALIESAVSMTGPP
jgi:hypothetical protein